MRTWFIALAAAALLAPVVAAGPIESTQYNAKGFVWGFTPYGRGVSFYGECHGDGSTSCASTGYIGGSWGFWFSTCTDNWGPEVACSDFTGSVLVRVHDYGCTADEVFRFDVVAGAPSIFYNDLAGDDFACNHIQITADVLSYHAFDAGDTGVPPSGGPWHFWITSAL